ncbi:hypothetical protein A1O3_00625 [Capronia epimyces CBS 606.96]|uniref:AB hydrolase-1 domain-containing protein n=1 Tax=Capronia epimyces CBS 606.96 TaxID=1182542 RepID=W9YQY2_9EURO|nr:uncharacterized protein A1O3_00625 [Capronia epimyces CBS 606.96]EXJ92075.1 hypothetical protein A1O3_00625 [Capronia epimyces CBS 606.96]
MDSLVLALPNGAAVTGLINLPSLTPATPKHRPFLVCLHGGTYSSSYFDPPGQSIKGVSDALGVPVVAIDRAGYGGSSLFGINGVVPEGSTYFEEEGNWLHDLVLPALWESYAVPHRLTCLVLLTHSMGTPPGIVAMARQSVEVKGGQGKRYIAGGVILSGWGFTPPPQTDENPPSGAAPSRPTRFNIPQKDIAMLGRPEDNLCDPHIYSLNQSLGTDMAFDEVDHGRRLWFNKAKGFTEQIALPIFYALGQYDLLWPPSEQEPHACESSFPNSPKVEGGVLLNAPHCAELGYQGIAWYVKAFGFALECAGSFKP